MQDRAASAAAGVTVMDGKDGMEGEREGHREKVGRREVTAS